MVQDKPKPVVFMFQPTRFEVVKGEKLKEWEKLLQERVGFRSRGGSFEDGGTCCVSYCPDADDCDQD